VAAQRGHDVTLIEKDHELGGQNRMTVKIASRANDGLYRELKGKVAVHAVGDALAPRRLDEAIIDGERIGRMI
jgi:NADPH-dependent 2,4-dienoyl-CoA reductase/sulfur reductase-like enzyme